MALPRRLALPHGIRARPTRLANSPGALTMALTRDRTRDQKRFEIREQVMDARASRYQEVYARSQRDPQAFWSEAAADIDWIEWPKQVFDPKAGVYGRWFTGVVCNTCWNAVDRHVLKGRGEQAAIIYDSPLAGQKRTITYHRLQVETQVLAAVLRDFGVEKGDRVILYMPMVPEAVIGMLACARIGAVHSVVFGGFAPRELATRIDDAKPKVILSASCGLEPGRVVNYKPLLDEAIGLAQHKPAACIVLQREQAQATLIEGRDHDWKKLRDHALEYAKAADCVPLAATDPLYILYTSGTTGQPKGVVRDNGGHAVALHWSMRHVYGMEPGEVLGGVRHRLGGRAFLHGLRAAPLWLHLDHV